LGCSRCTISAATTRRSLLETIPTDSFEVVHCNYVNVAALPLVLVVRKWAGV